MNYSPLKEECLNARFPSYIALRTTEYGEKILMMTDSDSERRRIQLLQQTRMLYSDRDIIPAVHPRYHAAYEQLYHSNPETPTVCRNSTFGIRLFLSCLLFALFVVADYKNVTYAEVDSKKIVQEIQREISIP